VPLQYGLCWRAWQDNWATTEERIWIAAGTTDLRRDFTGLSGFSTCTTGRHDFEPDARSKTAVSFPELTCVRVRLQVHTISKTMKMALIAVFACTTVIAQTKDQLRQRFGEPISETFLVRPGIVVTATYAPSGKITELAISPLNSSLIKSKNTTLSRESVDAVIEEIAPTSERGKFIVAEFADIICEPADDCSGASANYQNVTIYYNGSAKQGQVTYAVVQWKK
jgi:hypothetical protein